MQTPSFIKYTKRVCKTIEAIFKQPFIKFFIQERAGFILHWTRISGPYLITHVQANLTKVRISQRTFKILKIVVIGRHIFKRLNGKKLNMR